MVTVKRKNSSSVEHVGIRMTVEEKRKLKALAEAAEVSISDLIRGWIEDASKRITRKRKGKK